MMNNFPLYAVLVSFVGMFGIFAAHRRPNVREAVTIGVALAKFGLVAAMVPGVLDGETYVFSAGEFVAGIEFVLRADPLGVLFAALASLLWIVTSLYSIGYMRGLDEHSQTRYFAFFAASLSATMGIAFAGNLVTIFVFYELLSVATYPLVAHDGTDEARSAGRKYLAYTMFGGGVLVLAGTVLVFFLAGTVTFTPGGIEGLAEVANSNESAAQLAYLLLAVGFGVKAGLMPLHQWLPTAMVAPTPVSGLLHAVAVVKSGAFGVARVTLEVFGPEVAYQIGMGVAISSLAAFTLLAASFIALRKDHLKQRLAYSTVSQLSYIVLGLGIFGPYGLIGALLHIPAHAFMKLTLFFCAGAAHVETHTDHISEMAGIGKRMPVVFGAFALAAAGMAGIPLFAGFVSKYYMLIGAVGMGSFAPVGYYLAGALLVSGVLNIAYFWPVVYTAFFESEADHDAKPLVDYRLGGERRSTLTMADGGEGRRDEGRSSSDAASDGGRPVDDADDTDIDSEDLQPDFSGSLGERRDYSKPAPLVEGEYAVDKHPSDHATPAGEGDGAGADAEPDELSDASDDHADIDAHDAGHEGPPPGGWRRLSTAEALRGEETTWFMLGPILAAVTGAILVGIIPYELGFLELIELIVEGALAGAEVPA